MTDTQNADSVGRYPCLVCGAPEGQMCYDDCGLALAAGKQTQARLPPLGGAMIGEPR